MKLDSGLPMLHQDVLEVLVFVRKEKFLCRLLAFVQNALEHAFLFHSGPFVTQMWILVLLVPFVVQFFELII